jgi:selenide, water dikinase
VLQPLKEAFDPASFPDLLVGLAAADDAAVYRINEEQAIVVTTDFFPPVVDDPYDYGAIAAANALGDIYAMGGRPLFAVNLVAFPDELGLDHLRAILKGAAEKVAESGAVIAGGHSISDREPKYGLAAVGIVHPDKIITKGGSSPGQSLVLTKPLGTGVVTTALKREITDPDHVAAAVQSMKLLNRLGAEAAALAGVRSMTDITGFGLLGHAHEMAHLGEVDFRIFLSKLPWLSGARDYGAAGAFPGGMANNLNFFEPWVHFDEGVPLVLQEMLWTPETSGGLLAAVPADRVSTFLDACPGSVVGEVIRGDGHLHVISD